MKLPKFSTFLNLITRRRPPVLPIQTKLGKWHFDICDKNSSGGEIVYTSHPQLFKKENLKND